jgi:hypothetical protein
VWVSSYPQDTARPSDAAIKPCVIVGIFYPSQFQIVYKTSDGSPLGTPGDPVYSSSWQDCSPETPESMASAETIFITNAKIGLNDTKKSATSSRNFFFAGVFAGVLGALAIEIFNGTFDVAEHWSARRRARRDEQEQRPEPTPDPTGRARRRGRPGPVAVVLASVVPGQTVSYYPRHDHMGQAAGVWF